MAYNPARIDEFKTDLIIKVELYPASIIERYTIKLAPAVSHKKPVKRFQEGQGFEPEQFAKLHQVKARIELLCGPLHLQKIGLFLKELSTK